MDVVLLRWPAERDRRLALSRARVARLLLLDEDEPPPEPVDCLEDWVRTPVTETEIHARIAAVEARARMHAADVPWLDDDGVLHVGHRTTTIPPVEASLLRALLDRFAAVVGREALTRAAWPHQTPDRNLLDVHMLRLRRRLARSGLVIRTVRSRGYLLDHDAEADSSPAQGA